MPILSAVDTVQTSVQDGLVTRLVEFWPEPYAALANRAHLVEPIDPPR